MKDIVQFFDVNLGGSPVATQVDNSGTKGLPVSGSFTIGAGSTMAVTQDETPWVVGGTVSVDITAADTVTTAQGTSPWVIGGTATLAAGVNNIGTVAVSGTATVAGTVSVDITAADTVTAILASGGTVTVQGTVSADLTAADTVTTAQGGTWTVQPGNTPNTTAWNVNQIDLLNAGYILGTSTILRPAAVAINGTTAVTLMVATVSLTNYITDLVAFRTDAGATMAYVTMNDVASTPVPLPPISGAGTPIRVPIKGNGTNTAITFTSQSGITGFVVARGHTGT